jgi:hypothetical protein
MQKLSSIREICRERGARGAIESLWIEAVQESPASTLLSSGLDPIDHKRLVMAPVVGYWPQIREPRSFNEEIQHRLLLTDDELFTKVADKWGVREYVRRTVGSDILNDVHHVTDDPSSIPFEDLPNEFVVKATHGTSWNVFVTDKTEADFESIKQTCREWLDQQFGEGTDEYWYPRIDPKIVVEKYIDVQDRRVPLDYKFFVFNGQAEFVHVDLDRLTQHKRRFYDVSWEPLDFTFKYPMAREIPSPPNLDEMVEIAEELGTDFDFVRVDLYNPSEDTILFGEMTLAPEAGKGRFSPVEWDFKMGSYWDHVDEPS